MKPAQKIGIFHFLLLGGFLFALFLVAPTSRANAAASLYLAPSSGSFTIGSTFNVSIYVNTDGQNVNAVEANLSFPPDKLQVVSPTTGKSFIQVWVAQPTYSNEDGTIKFQGTVPTPGINTSAGLVSALTFRVKSLGTAAIKILDSSRVLLNDGRGTDILGEKTSGIYYLTLPPPAGPIVTSRTHPDQEKWYTSNDVVFEWTAPPDIQGYSYVLNQDPVSDLDDISEGTKTRVVYNNLADGIHYFHIKALRQDAWGGTTDYVVKIDSTPPAAFKINFSPGEKTSNLRPIIDFSTTDAVSDVEHYELKIIPLDPPQALAGQNNTPFFFEVDPPYSKKLDYGRYEVVARAYDEAGNYSQTEAKLTIAKPIFEIIGNEGLRIGGAVFSWPIVSFLATVVLIILGYLSKMIWAWHREAEEYLLHGALKHPAISGKLGELKEKQKEYGGGKSLMVIVLLLVLGLGLFSAKGVFAAMKGSVANPPVSQTIDQADNISLEPPIITLFPKSISNDEILYIGGRAEAPMAKVLIYLQRLETGGTENEIAITDKDGAWFYSFPKFLNSGNYIAWTQIKVGEQLSPPSSKMELVVAPTAIQIGGGRLSYENLYLILFIIFAIAFFGLVTFSLYHGYHFKVKNKRLNQAIREAEESIRRGFSIIRRDIEAELALVRRIKTSKEFSAEEKIREEKLIKDLAAVSSYLSKEIWEIEKTEGDRS